MFEDDDWGRVENASGEYARVESLAGHLLIVFPIGYIDHSPTRFTQAGKPSDVIVCDVIDLDAPDETGAPGKIYRTAWWRSSKLIVGLRPLIGKKILGRISKGLAQNGMNPPWVINDVREEPGALDRARAWAQVHPDFTVSTFTPPPAVPRTPAPVAPAGPAAWGGSPPGQQYTPGSGYQGPARQQFEVAPQQFQNYPAQPQGYPAQGYPAQVPPQPQGYPAPQPQYQQQPPGYQAQPPVQQPPVQQPPASYQQQSQQQVPMFPVSGAPQQDQNMLEVMRAERERREMMAAQGQYQDNPPF